METQEVVRSFMVDCELRELKPRTKEFYSRYLKRYASTFPQLPFKAPIIQGFLLEFKGVYNRHGAYRALSALYNYAGRMGFYNKDDNPMRFVSRPRLPDKIQPTLTHADLLLLAEELKKPETKPKNRALMVLLVDTGIRLGELLTLERRNIQDKFIIVSGKRGYRVVPLSEIAKDLLLALPVYDDGYVFHGLNRGKNSPRLGKTGAYKVIRYYLKKILYAGGSQYGAQTFRRTYGRVHTEAGGDPKSLQLQFGHQNLQTTLKYYLPWCIKDVVEKHDAYSPGRVFTEVQLNE